MDQFTSALQHLLSVHEEQIQALNEQLEGEQREKKELEQRIESLQKANDDASKVVEQAKKKIKQQAKVIRNLKQQRQNSKQEELTSKLLAAIDATPEAAPITTSTSTSTIATHKLDQTCATLFESPAPATVSRSKVSESGTPERPFLVQTVEARDEPMPISAREGSVGPGDYHREESAETVADHDVIILEDDVIVNGNDNPTHLSSKSATRPAPQDENETCEIVQASLPPSGPASLPPSSPASIPPSGPVHVVYSHAHEYGSTVCPLEDRNGMSSNQKRAQTSSRPLSLRDGGSTKVKWKEVSSSLASSSGSLSETRLSLSPEKAASPQHDSEGTSASSSPEQSSPSLLGSSISSPWKVQHSGSSPSLSKQHSSTPITSVNMSQSLFAKTPAVGQTVTVGGGSVVVTTPITMLKSAIPHSDSQLSFDVSQSAPLSPELCLPTNHFHSPKSIPKERRATKASAASVMADSSPLCVDRSVVPITPGVPSVDKILRGQKGWVVFHGRSARTTAAAGKLSSLRSVSGKRGQDQLDFEDEDILPPKSKVHKLASVQDKGASFVDYDQTRLEEMVEEAELEDEEDCSGAMSPVLLYNINSGGAAAERNSDLDRPKMVTGDTEGKSATTSNETLSVPQPQQLKHDQKRLMEKAGLPTGYKYDTRIRRKVDRDKLEGKACPDCDAWFAKDDGIHGDVESHLRCACRHKYLHPPPKEDSKIWDMSFPETAECDYIMDRRSK